MNPTIEPSKTDRSIARLIPGPADLVFGIVLGLVLIGGRHGLFNDPGTPWHLRLGREILATGQVPRCDTLTSTRQGVRWIDQSWGFDALLAALVDHWGWSSVIAATALGLALLYATLTRDLLRDGASPLAAIIATMLATAIGAIHFLIRPHLFTLAFAYLTFRACQRQHERGGWIVFRVPLYTMILANLHGGFVILPAIAMTAALGHGLSGGWDQARRREVAKFTAASVLSMIAALANPYGFGLYWHVANLLHSSGVTALIDEYQPPAFGTPEGNAIEWVILAIVGLSAISARRIDRYHLVHLLVWLHLTLSTIRNAPFFALAAAPVLSTLIDGLPHTIRTSWKPDDRASIWPSVAIASVVLLAVLGIRLGGPDPRKWPLDAMAIVDRQPASARLFHEQDWGGLIEAESSTIRRAYIDDRFELFGRTMILEYVDALTGGPAWDVIRDRDNIDLVWLRPDRGLARRLLKEPGWHVIYRDKVSILFHQVPGTSLSEIFGPSAFFSFRSAAWTTSSGIEITHSETCPARAL